MTLALDYPSQSYELDGYPPFGFPLTEERHKRFESLPPVLRSDGLTVIYVGVPDERGTRTMWHLSGPRAGREGVKLATDVSGLVHPPFRAAWHESAWMVGAVPGHVSWPKRPLNIGVHIGVVTGPKTIQAPDGSLERIVPVMSEQRYRLVHQAWWDSFSAEEDGDLVCFSRAFGFRSLKVRLESEPKNPFPRDPTAFGNNLATTDMPLVASLPFFRHTAGYGTWRNHEDTSTPLDVLEDAIRVLIPDLDLSLAKDAYHLIAEALGNFIPGLDVGEGKITIRNNGDQPVWPEYVIHSGSGGFCWLPDGDRMVLLPKLHQSDGEVLVSTDPSKQTFTAESDPVDIGFLGIVKRSQILDLVLSPILDATEPLWKRGSDVAFTQQIPARSTVTLNVRHSNANAIITARVPQWHNGPGI